MIACNKEIIEVMNAGYNCISYAHRDTNINARLNHY